MKKILIWGFMIVLFAGSAFFLLRGEDSEKAELKTVKATIGTIAEKALAVGTIEPDNEIRVKSTISGIITEIYFKVGDKIEKGEPLFKVSPNPTPLEYAEKKRNVEMAEVVMHREGKIRDRKLELFKANLIPKSEMDKVNSTYDEATLKYKMAKEKFQLMEKGRIKVANRQINSIIKSPISGVVLSQTVFEGDPVVPLTNFQPGTELCSMADMRHILFKGTVDEIDVGKIRVGMNCDIQIGALPEAKIKGELQRISPKAKKDGNATLFDIEVIIKDMGGVNLRAGYSATSYVKIKESKDVVVVPERLVKFEKDKAYVEISRNGTVSKIEVKTGLSDSMNIEIKKGVKVGALIVERPPREIK